MTAMNSIVTNSLATIATINAEVKRLNEEAKSARQRAIEQFLNNLASSGEVSIIVVRGYTPGWNDGEPCEHSADLYVNIKELRSEEIDEDIDLELPEELVDGLQSETMWNRETREYVTDTDVLSANINLCQKHGHVYESPSPDVRKAIETLIFDTVEDEEDTNYFVAYVLKDGKFVVERGEYDCGH